MHKIYAPIICFVLISCSTQVQYVGNTYSRTKRVEVFVTDTAISKAYTVIGRGYIKGSYRGINWNKVRTSSIKKGISNGADAVFIISRNAVSPLPALKTHITADSVGQMLRTTSNTQTYFPVSSWHDILFVKYNE